MHDQAGTQFVEITLNEIPVTNLIPENITLSLNGTSYLETNQDIAESINQFTISAWIKPEFNAWKPTNGRNIQGFDIPDCNKQHCRTTAYTSVYNL